MHVIAVRMTTADGDRFHGANGGSLVLFECFTLRSKNIIIIGIRGGIGISDTFIAVVGILVRSEVEITSEDRGHLELVSIFFVATIRNEQGMEFVAFNDEVVIFVTDVLFKHIRSKFIRREHQFVIQFFQLSLRVKLNQDMGNINLRKLVCLRNIQVTAVVMTAFNSVRIGIIESFTTIDPEVTTRVLGDGVVAQTLIAFGSEVVEESVVCDGSESNIIPIGSF
mmetsp:Transcript_52785/g.60431  ORF Transcript_52785/g.60431 Transcript_52785/m.60431 type:complete len:224 (+) Transcript_52785:561-1232(+)